VLRGEEAASDELLLACSGEEGRTEAAGVVAACWELRGAWEGIEQEMFRLQYIVAVILVIRI